MKNEHDLEVRMQGLMKRMLDLPLRGRPPEDNDLSFPQLGLIMRVARTPGCGVLDIAGELRLSAPTVSVGVRKLVREGYLEQKRDPEDKRARPLFLTEKGASLAGRMHAQRKKIMNLFLSGLTPEEQTQLFDLLERAISSLEDKLGTAHQEIG